MELYENIKSLRKARGWSQQQLAESVGYGDRSSIAKIESGKVDLPRSKIAEFAKVFGVTPAYLLGYSEETYTLMNQLIEDNNSGRPAAIDELRRRFGTEHSTLSVYVCEDKKKLSVLYYHALERDAALAMKELIQDAEQLEPKQVEKIMYLVKAYLKAEQPIRDIVDTALRPYTEEEAAMYENALLG